MVCEIGACILKYVRSVLFLLLPGNITFIVHMYRYTQDNASMCKYIVWYMIRTIWLSIKVAPSFYILFYFARYRLILERIHFVFIIVRLAMETLTAPWGCSTLWLLGDPSLQFLLSLVFGSTKLKQKKLVSGWSRSNRRFSYTLNFDWNLSIV